MNEPKKPKNFKDRTRSTYKRISSSDFVQKLKDFTKDNKWESSAILILLIGLVATLINPFFGSSIIGVLTGYYFWEEILDFLTNLQSYIVRNSFIKLAILAILLVIFFIAYPLFFISTAIVISIMQLIEITGKRKN